MPSSTLDAPSANQQPGKYLKLVCRRRRRRRRYRRPPSSRWCLGLFCSNRKKLEARTDSETETGTEKPKTSPISKKSFPLRSFHLIFIFLQFSFQLPRTNWSQYLQKNTNHPLPDNHTLNARRWRACVSVCVCVCV